MPQRLLFFSFEFIFNLSALVSAAWTVYQKKAKHTAPYSAHNRAAGNAALSGGTSHIMVIQIPRQCANENGKERSPKTP
jgi:hypothetical protein